jgi:hypothetical protein
MAAINKPWVSTKISFENERYGRPLFIGLLDYLTNANIEPPSMARAIDRPEPGKQGGTMPGEAVVVRHHYSKGVRVVGHAELGKRSGNLIMLGRIVAPMSLRSLHLRAARRQRNRRPRSGVAVVDMRDSRKPMVTHYLQGKGALDALETMHAITTPARSVLAAGT